MILVEEFLHRLAGDIRRAAGPDAVLTVEGAGLDYEIRVEPSKGGPCPFIVHAQSEDEITIEFGAFSVAHIASSDWDALVRSCRKIVDQIVAGQVKEAVWIRGGTPCRAEAEMGGDGYVTKFKTRHGLCLNAERKDRQYTAYPGSQGIDI
jgi:hypothetical protein